METILFSISFFLSYHTYPYSKSNDIQELQILVKKQTEDFTTRFNWLVTLNSMNVSVFQWTSMDS